MNAIQQPKNTVTVGPFGPWETMGRGIAETVDVDDKQVGGILKIRDGATLRAAGCDVYSRSEVLTILLGAGTPAALRRLAKMNVTLREAWDRIDARQRAIVMAAWTGELDAWRIG